MKHLIHQPCPDFAAPAIMPDGTLNPALSVSEYFAEHFGVIFFYPLDFNAMSLMELASLQKRKAALEQLKVKLVVISCDSTLAHQAWRKIPQGLGNFAFPMLSDMTHGVAQLFDVLVARAMPEAATVIVAPDTKVIYQCRNDTAYGRNIDRMMDVIRAYADPEVAPAASVDQILQLENNAADYRKRGFTLVAQSADSNLDHPQWQRLPRDKEGKPALSFPLVFDEYEWPRSDDMTLAIREGLAYHDTGLLMPDGQVLFEYFADRKIARDFTEILRIADAVKQHQSTGKLVPWETVA